MKHEIKSALAFIFFSAVTTSAQLATAQGVPPGPPAPPKSYDPADPVNWKIVLLPRTIYDWTTVNWLGIPESGHDDSDAPGLLAGALPAMVTSNSMYSAFLQMQCKFKVSATWIGLGAAPSSLRMQKAANGEGQAYQGTVELTSGVSGVEPTYTSWGGGIYGQMGGSKPFQLPIGGEGGPIEWTTKGKVTCSGTGGGAMVGVGGGANLAEVSTRLVSDVEQSSRKLSEDVGTPNLIVEWGKNTEDSAAGPFSVNGGGAVIAMTVTAVHSGANVPHTWELEYDGQGSPGYPPFQPPTPATTSMTQIGPGKWQLLKILKPNEYAALADSPLNFKVSLTGKYSGEEGAFTRKWESTILIHALHSNWVKVGNDIHTWVTPEYSEVIWPSPCVVRSSGHAKIKWSWAYPAVTIATDSISGNAYLQFLDDLGLGTKFISLAKKASAYTRAAFVEPVNEEANDFDSLFVKVVPFEPGAPVSTFSPPYNFANQEAEKRNYIMDGAHREFKFLYQFWKGDQYGKHGFEGRCIGKTEKYVGTSEAVGNFKKDGPGGNADDGGNNGLPS